MAAITYQFTPASDDALFSKMPTAAFMIHCYGLKRQQITGWKFNKTDICKTLGLSMSTVKKYLKWLREHGYASYERLKFQFTQWRFYPTPITKEQARSPRIIERSTFDTVEQSTFDTVLIIERNLERNEQQREPIPENPVVVFLGENLQGTDHEPMPIPDSDPIPAPEPIPLQDPEPIPAPEPVKEPVSSEKMELIYPEQLNTEQKKNAKHVIKKAPVELRQDVLFELLYRITNAKLYNPIGYLNTLITAVNNGPFTFAYKLDKAFMATITKKPDIPIAQKRLEKVDNDKFFSDLINRFGNKAVAAIRGAS